MKIINLATKLRRMSSVKVDAPSSAKLDRMTWAKTVETNAGIIMPRMIYGTAWKKDATESLVVQAVLAGFRGIDTACQPKHYFEPGVGAALHILATEHAIRRDQLFVQTKFTSLDGQDPHNVPYDTKADLATQVRQSLEQSLKNLGTDYLDSWVLHSPMKHFDDTMLVWREFEKFVQVGKVKQLGISNCYSLHTLKDLYDQSHVKPSVLQNRFYEDSHYDKEIRDFCRRHNIFYQSFWTLTANRHHLQSPSVLAASHAHGVTPAQVWFKFLSQRHDIVILTGTKNEKHMKQDLEIFDWELDEDEMVKMDKLI